MFERLRMSDALVCINKTLSCSRKISEILFLYKTIVVTPKCIKHYIFFKKEPYINLEMNKMGIGCWRGQFQI